MIGNNCPPNCALCMEEDLYIDEDDENLTDLDCYGIEDINIDTVED